MTTPKDILNQIKEKEVKYVDVRFTDMRGKMQHVTFDIDLVDDDFLTDGTMFDGSSIAGWKAINESDMKLRPDLKSAYIDPFYQQTTLCLFCDVLNPDTNEPYNRDPRSIAQKALAYTKAAGVGDTVYFGPEAEFFIFDDVPLVHRPQRHRLFLRLDRTAGQHRQDLRRRQHGPPPGPQGRLLPGQPGGLGAGPARRDAGGDGRAGHASPRSTTTRWRRRSTSWA